MKMVMRYEVSFIGKNFDEEFNYLDLGGYYFLINGKEIPFDFEAYAYGIEDDKRGRNEGRDPNRIYMSYESGKGLAFSEYEVDSCYDHEYEKLGLTKEDITAEFLASTEKIIELYLDSENETKDLRIESMSFEDVSTEEIYEVPKEVLQNYEHGVF